MKTQTAQRLAKQICMLIAGMYGTDEEDRPPLLSIPIIPVNNEKLHEIKADIRQNFTGERYPRVSIEDSWATINVRSALANNLTTV